LLDTFTDYLNLDYNRHLHLKDIEVYKSNLKPNSDSILTKKLIVDPSGDGYKFMNRNHIKGSFGYIIKPCGATKLIAGVNKDGIVPSDVSLNLYYIDVSYTEPSLVKLNDEMLHNKLKLSHTR
jgi:GR25 family glycosyltransferase involved in LPS biosynthesis